MLAELAAANAAFAVISRFVKNGQELSKAGSAISDYVTAKDLLHKKATKKKSSLISRATGKTSNDFEEFMAIEELKKKEDKLRETMQLFGRPGLWNDWVKFQAEARVKRQKQLEAQIKARKELMENIMLALLIMSIVGGIGAIVYWVAVVKWL